MPKLRGIAMRTFLLSMTAIGLCLSVSSLAVAQTAVDPENVRAQDVVTSPLADINVKKRDVPLVLETALIKPYDLEGLKSCRGLSTAIADLDGALGDDIDVAYAKSSDEKAGNSAGSVAKSVIGSFIPFRGIIREISGANANERAWQRALYAGAVRRAFLKGVGQQRGCAYPARSATAQVVASLNAQREATKVAAKLDKDRKQEEKTAGAMNEPSSE